jgi:hypothetical protein
MPSPFDFVPAEHRDAARSALTSAFGAAPITDLRPVAGGASGALTYRVEIAGGPRLLRLETPRADRFRNPVQDTAIRQAAAAGIAPPLHHVGDGAAVMDFLPNRPLADFPGGPEGLARAAGDLIRRWQATPSLHPMIGYDEFLARMLGTVQAHFAPGLLDPHAAAFARIRAAWPWDPATTVASHNDPNPRNILFDGERLWLVDWETAYGSDPFVDVAILADNFAPTPALEEALLEAWSGRAPDAMMRAKLALMRPMTRLYYAGLIFSGLPAGEPDGDLTPPGPGELERAVGEGRLVVGAPDMMRLLGKACLAGFMAGASGPAFEEALAIVAAG